MHINITLHIQVLEYCKKCSHHQQYECFAFFLCTVYLLDYGPTQNFINPYSMQQKKIGG